MDFLIHLHHDKGLSISAVKGYSSALNSVLALKGRDLASYREITMLLRSFSRSVNPVELRPPAWDVALVLQSLTGAPYEPLRTCDECFLAQKTLFLLALALAKRIGELHALSYRVSHTRGWAEVSFSIVPGFVAKTQDPSSIAPRFEGFSVPALPNVRNNRNGRLLCPVWAVMCYLDCTDAHRLLCERLFVTAARSKKEISKTTVSFWLRKMISRAYELSGTEQPVPAPRAREARGITPSLLFKKNFAVDQVLKAGTWRRHTTFTRHYLRDRCLPPGPCGGGTGLGLILACSPGHITPNDYGLTFDDSILCLSPSIHQHPLRAVVSMVSVCLHTYMYSIYFMEICDYIDMRFSRSFLKVTLDSFSSPAPSIFMPGRHG